MSSVRVVDAAGTSFTIAGCSTIGELKESILQHTGMPVDKQRLARAAEKEIELTDESAIQADEEMQLLVDGVNGGCEVRPFFIKIQNFECKFRSVKSQSHWHSTPRHMQCAIDRTQ